MVVPRRLWPAMIDTDVQIKGRLQEFYQPQSSHSVAYLDFGVTTNGILVGIKVCKSSSFIEILSSINVNIASFLGRLLQLLIVHFNCC